MARFCKLRELDNYDFFVIPTSEEMSSFVDCDEFDLSVSDSRVFVRCPYDKTSNQYSYCHYINVSSKFFCSGDTLVIVEFYF